MKILAVTNIYPTAGNPTCGTFVEQQVQGLRAIGLDVDVMYVDRLQGGMTIYARLHRDILARVAETRPDLVHVMFGGFMADVVTHAIRDVPVVVSFCGTDLLGEHLSGPVRRAITWLSVGASRRAARRADGIVVKSRNLFQALPGSLDRSRVRIIPNGIDPERFKPADQRASLQALGWSPGRFHVLFPFNQGDRRKRPWLAQAAVDRLAARGVPTELHFLRGVPHSEVPLWLNASDAVLLTSLHEGSPNLVKEALACNTPVVSVDVGDVAERVEGIAGCYIALPQEDALADRLWCVHERGGRIDARSRMQDLSLERVASRLLDFYVETRKRWDTARVPSPALREPPRGTTAGNALPMIRKESSPRY